MKTAPAIFAVLSLLVLAGCSAAGVERAAVPDQTAGAPIVDSIPADGRVISDINIELCQKTAGDKPHTVDEALRALKLTARQKGATGVANVTSSLVTTPTSNCYAMAQATGIAYTQG